MVVLGTGTPEVKGTAVAEVAPEKAADAIVAVGFGVRDVALGFRTLWGGLLAGFFGKIGLTKGDQLVGGIKSIGSAGG